MADAPELAPDTAAPDDGALRHHGDVDAAPGLLDFAVNVQGGGPPRMAARPARRHPRRPRPATRPPRTTRGPATAVAARHGRRPDEVLVLAGSAEGFALLPALRPRLAAVLHPGFTEPEAALRPAGVPVVRVLTEEARRPSAAPRRGAGGGGPRGRRQPHQPDRGPAPGAPPCARWRARPGGARRRGVRRRRARASPSRWPARTSPGCSCSAASPRRGHWPGCAPGTPSAPRHCWPGSPDRGRRGRSRPSRSRRSSPAAHRRPSPRPRRGGRCARAPPRRAGGGAGGGAGGDGAARCRAVPAAPAARRAGASGSATRCGPAGVAVRRGDTFPGLGRTTSGWPSGLLRRSQQLDRGLTAALAGSPA